MNANVESIRRRKVEREGRGCRPRCRYFEESLGASLTQLRESRIRRKEKAAGFLLLLFFVPPHRGETPECYWPNTAPSLNANRSRIWTRGKLTRDDEIKISIVEPNSWNRLESCRATPDNSRSRTGSWIAWKSSKPLRTTHATRAFYSHLRKKTSRTFLPRHGYFRNGLARELRVFRRRDRESTRLRKPK